MITMSISFLDLLMKGGWLMVPLCLLSVISVFIFCDRYFYIRSQEKSESDFFEKITGLIKEKRINAALDLCKSKQSPESRILGKGLQNLGRPLHDIHEQMEMEGKLEVYKYEGNMYFPGVNAKRCKKYWFLVFNSNLSC